jgi:hypothetical protein
MARSTLFHETQRLRSRWLWGLLGLVGGLLLVTGAWFGLAILLPVAAVLWVSRLTTDVREDGVYVQFWPFHRSHRRIPFEEIERVEPTAVGLLTYGGIGIRWTPTTIAYLTAPGSGVELHRADAKSVVIGSQDADRLAETIETQRS